MHWFKADLHIHTVLSPCAELSMGPRDIVARAKAAGLDIIAVTDHNSAQNVAAVVAAADGSGLTVIPGMEVYTREEAHLICLFENVPAALHFQEVIFDHLPEGENDPDWFGPQYIVDADENILGENKKLLALPTSLHAHEVVSFVIDLGGIVYPAHIDRQANSLLRALGFIPTNLPLHGLEITRPFEEAVMQFGFLQKTPYSIIRASDAHSIEQVGEKFTWFHLEAPAFAELKQALAKSDGRYTSLKKMIDD